MSERVGIVFVVTVSAPTGKSCVTPVCAVGFDRVIFILVFVLVGIEVSAPCTFAVFKVVPEGIMINGISRSANVADAARIAVVFTVGLYRCLGINMVVPYPTTARTHVVRIVVSEGVGVVVDIFSPALTVVGRIPLCGAGRLGYRRYVIVSVPLRLFASASVACGQTECKYNTER